MSLVLTGIGYLVTNDPAAGDDALGVIRQAALVIDDAGKVAWAGPARSLGGPSADSLVDLGGRTVIPGFVDTHTHLVFAGERSAEWEARMAGRGYEAGGILTTVEATRAASDAELAGTAGRLAAEALRSGTTTIEIKSGYGLNVDDEARCLRIARAVTEEVTFLGAHVVGPEFVERPDDYVDLVCGEMLRRCAPSARWVDAFCERGAFDADQTRKVLAVGTAAGLLPRVHANQLGFGPGVQIGVEMGAASVDHCTHLAPADVDALAETAATTVATLLPAAEFSAGSAYPDARRLLDAGAVVALATDCNPGSSFTTSMPFVIALAVREMHMSAAEALWAATAGGARALRRNDVGRLSTGAWADLAVLDAPNPAFLAYRPGVDLVVAVVRRGELVAGRWPA